MPPRPPSSLVCFHVMHGPNVASVRTNLKAADFNRQRERTRFYTISYYQSFTNGSKRFVSKSTWEPTFSLEPTTIALSRPGFCVNYSVQVTAVGKASVSTPISSLCHRGSFMRFGEWTERSFISIDIDTCLRFFNCFSQFEGTTLPFASL